MNKEINFGLSILLKKKGYNELCMTKWGFDGSEEEYIKIGLNSPSFINSWSIAAPTISDVVMWLYKKHGIWISTDCDCYGLFWFSKLSVASEKLWDDLDKRHDVISATKKFPNEHNSPSEAYEAAIKYTLNNLI